MLRTAFLSSCLLSLVALNAQPVPPAKTNTSYGRPAVIATADLAEFATLPADRKRLIEESISVAKNEPWLPYTARGAKPSDGGLDCSGAMYYVMRRVGLDPPRPSAEQFLWLKQQNRLHPVPKEAASVDHPSLISLQPGDLLFWGRHSGVGAAAEIQITHVAMYLGTEKKDRRPVMINSTDGRSYRGTKANGYGVYDFKLPAADAKIAFMGYGTPPGIAEVVR